MIRCVGLRRRKWNLVPAAALTCFTGFLTACSSLFPSVEQGQVLYKSNGCATCHGASGRGDGPLAGKLGVAPANLQDPMHFKNGATEEQIANTIAQGIVNPALAAEQQRHEHHELAMPKFDHLSEVQRRSIALYVISMKHSQQ
jgi:mono/diheme cytochrome c family protein